MCTGMEGKQTKASFPMSARLLPLPKIREKKISIKKLKRRRRKEVGPIAIMRHGVTIRIHLLINPNQPGGVNPTSRAFCFLFFSLNPFSHSLKTIIPVLFTCRIDNFSNSSPIYWIRHAGAAVLGHQILSQIYCVAFRCS